MLNFQRKLAGAFLYESLLHAVQIAFRQSHAETVLSKLYVKPIPLFVINVSIIQDERKLSHISKHKL